MKRITKVFPNFLYLGPDKSGSTWIYELLKWHPQVFMSPAKELFYFNFYYHHGPKWYSKQFKGAAKAHKIIGEVSHDYLFSNMACTRIFKDLESVKLMACLREPVDRAFSSYLFMLRQGRLNCSFETALKNKKELIDHGLYAKHLTPYLKTFGHDRIHISLFDDLKENSAKFAKDLFKFLDIAVIELSPELLEKALPASRARSLVFARLVKKIAIKVRNIGFPSIVSKIKASPSIQKMLYEPYQDWQKPKIAANTVCSLKEIFHEGIIRLDELFGLEFVSRWGYDRLKS